MTKEQFAEALAAQGISLTDRQKEQFDQFFRLLVEWNEKMNLTGITEEGQVYIKHFYDSITPAFYFPFDQVKSVVDIGGGAGFPSIPLKICFPHLKMTIIDSLNKRMSFAACGERIGAGRRSSRPWTGRGSRTRGRLSRAVRSRSCPRCGTAELAG